MADLDLRSDPTATGAERERTDAPRIATARPGSAQPRQGSAQPRQERARIARELHDRLGRMLGHVDVELDRLIATGCDGEDLRRLQHATRHAVDDLRTTLQRLRDEPTGSASPGGDPAADGEVIVLDDDRGDDRDDDRGDVLLSERQVEILQAIAHGATTKQVARSLDITQKTVHNHLNAVYRRLGTQSLTHAVLSAMRLGIIALD
jgi:DNA-binding CsgD family transcriptional regulator